jgi:hypothetical protein
MRTDWVCLVFSYRNQEPGAERDKANLLFAQHDAEEAHRRAENIGGFVVQVPVAAVYPPPPPPTAWETSEPPPPPPPSLA